jgi:hypothetical protein
MPQENGSPHVSAAKRVAEHARALTHLERELWTLELKRKARALGTGAGLGLAAGLLALLGLCFIVATVAAALATAMSVWLALLIVAGSLFLFAGIAGIAAISLLKR